MTTTQNALEGIRILDFSHVFQGPVATQILADYGADVIKIERPGAGDWSRSWGPYVNGVSMPYAGLNRNKRCIAVDVKATAGKRIILQLVEQADVLVHNFRSGVMERLGLGYDDLKIGNTRLIYARSTGWGDSGPYVERGRGGHDLMARAEGGWFYQANPDEPPVPAGIPLDYAAGMNLSQAILIALISRERTGRGQLVTTDLLSVAFHAHAWDSVADLNLDRIQESDGVGAAEADIDKSFKTQDGWIEISPVFSPNVLGDISVALGLDDLSVDPRFAAAQDRHDNKAEVNAELGARFAQKSTDEWIEILEPQGVLCAKIRTFAEAAEDPQIQANNMVVEMEHPKAGTLRLLGTPVRLYGTPPTYRIPPADLGQHTQEILVELGYSSGEIVEMERQGLFGQ